MSDPVLEKVKLSEVEFHDEIVAREVTDDPKTIQEYAEVYKREPGSMPAPRLYRVGSRLFVTRGRHRVHSAIRAGLKYLECEVVEGNLDDAKWDAAGGNTDQLGLRRTNADKERAIRLAILAFPKRTDSAVAEHVRVRAEKVKFIRKQMEEEGSVKEETERVSTDGRKRKAVDSKHTPKPKSPSDEKDPEPAAPSPALHDAAGTPVVGSALDVFADNRLGDFLDAVKRVSELIEKASVEYEGLLRLESRLPWVEWGRLMKLVPEWSGLTADIFHAANAGVPFVVCKECEGEGCPDCRGSGYWPKWRYDNLPEYGG